MRGGQPELGLPGGLRARCWAADDATGLLLAMRDPLVHRYAGFVVIDRADALIRVQRYAATWRSGEGLAWAIVDAGGQVLGSVRFAITDRELGCGMVGYWLLPEARGFGVATAAVRAGSTIVLRHLGWHRVELRHAVENARSCAVARRCGYRVEGIMREGMRYPSDGRWSDEHVHARLGSDPEPR